MNNENKFQISERHEKQYVLNNMIEIYNSYPNCLLHFITEVQYLKTQQNFHI